MTEADLPMVHAWRNHPQIRRCMLTQHEISEQEHHIWFAKVSQDSSCALLIVEEHATPIGYVQFTQVNKGATADWGFYVRPDAPQGTGRKLGVAALNHAFGNLQVHKVCGRALAFNTDSIAFHERLGFTQEGVLREQHQIGGEYHALMCFGLLRHEWQAY